VIQQANPRLALLVFGLLIGCCDLHAQQNNSSRGTAESAGAPAKLDSFALERENSDHVAASPQQIREVLVKDPGLLVELKHGVSKEATSSGQMIDDADLSDQAIFDRLDRDVVFRSAATRLLQRYGYLLPSINPDSELGKQQELILKERARRLVQIEAQEDAETLKRPGEEEVRQAVLEENSCDRRQGLDCRETATPRSRQNDNLPSAPARPGSRGTPIPSDSSTTSPLLRAGGNSGPTLTPAVGADDSANSIRQAAFSGSPDLLTFRASMADAESFADSLRGTATNVDASSLRGVNGSTRARDYRRSNVANEKSSRGSISTDSNGDRSQGTIVHKQSPYADIPSLYDLYVQVPGREGAPERFGIDILSGGLREPDALPMDLPVGPDYVVGPGDGLAIDLWGGVSQRMTRVVDSQGRISLPEAGPLLVSGRTLGDIQLTVQQVLRSP